MELISVALSLCAILLTLFYYIRRKYSYWQSIGAPFIKPSFPYGNLKSSGHKEHPCLTLQKCYNAYKGKHPFVGLYFYLTPAALILDPEITKSIMIKDFQYFHDRGHYFNEKDDPISAHLFSIYGHKWKTLRTKMTPTFTSGKMKSMFPIVLEVGQRLQDKFEHDCLTKPVIDVKSILGDFTTDVIGNVAFGIECNSLFGENNDFSEAGRLVFQKPRHRVSTIIFLLTIREYALKFGIKSQRDDTTAFYTKVVSDTIRYRDENNIVRNDFMNMLMELRKPDKDGDGLNFNEILAQAFIFLLAGFETSSTLMTFCLYELSYNPDIQEKTRQHISDVLQKYNGKFTYEALLDMKYLEQVLNETLRLYPPVPTLTRWADKDYKIPNTEFILKKGSVAVFPIYGMHRDPLYFPNPEKFNPENFSPENVQNRHPQIFIPFGDGPRICIGLRFGMMQAKIGIVMALQKFQFSPAPTTKYPIEISSEAFTFVPVGGMPLHIEPLKKN